MILTDGVHLCSDTSTEELHEFAGKIGLKRSWFQEHTLHPHYDLTTPRASRRAIDGGAVKVTGKVLVLRCSKLFNKALV